ncbi:MAG: hypothetical protein ACI4I4_07005 [Acutalibacteraceae bacterium]
MPFDISAFYYKYNSKTKVYPDGTAVAIYCNKPKFSMASQKKKKIEEFTPEYWYNLKYFDCVALFHGFYFDYTVNHIVFDEHYAPHFKPVELEHPYFCADPVTGEVLLRLQDGSEPPKTKLKQRADNVKRACDKIYDIVMMNDWDYFFTGTFGDTTFNPKEAKEVLKPMRNWLNNQQKRNGLKYILVPEYQPKSGKIHFHGFLKGNIKVVDSGTRKVKGYDKPKKISTCKRLHIDLDTTEVVYNLPDWKFGFTTATAVYNVSPKMISYITKYITKDTSKIFGNSYWASKKGLKREVDNIFYEDVDFDSILAKSYSIPHTTDEYKYYTFFPGQNHFHWEEEYKQAQSNTDDILAALNAYDVSDNNFIPFEEC